MLDFEVVSTLKEVDLIPILLPSFSFPSTVVDEFFLGLNELPSLFSANLSLKSGKLARGPTGDVGRGLNETNEGSMVNDDGAKIIKVRSSDVKFEA